MNKSIQFAQNSGVFISKTDINIVKTARESFLFNIMLAEPKESLNVRTEILNKCRHKGKFTLAKI